MNSKNDKQATRSQIELLKQKYLKKNVQSTPQEPKACEPTPKNIEMVKIEAATNNEKKESKIEQNRKKQQERIGASTKEAVKDGKKVDQTDNNLKDAEAKQWSLRRFMEQQSKEEVEVKTSKMVVNEGLDILKNERDPFNLNYPFYFGHTSNITTDPQFQPQISQQSQVQHIQTNKVRQKTIGPENLTQACKLWVQNPIKCLTCIFYENSDTQFNQTTLVLKSSNPSFPGIVQQLAQQFVFTNSHILKESQKQVVYNMALQYFSPSPRYLSDVLIITLVKIAPSYGTVYIDEIIRKPAYYMQKIIQFKKYLLKQELENLFKFVEERLQNLRTNGHKLPIEIYVWVLLLRPNSNYCHQILLAQNIENEKDYLRILCALNSDGKQNSLSILYLKCIDALIPLFINSGVLEKVISNLNELKIPELLYQPVKSLKLKLIKAADTKKQKKKSDQQKGFTSFLNQKMNKLKDVLESRVNAKPKIDLQYDPGTGAYQPQKQLQETIKF